MLQRVVCGSVEKCGVTHYEEKGVKTLYVNRKRID